MAGGGGSSREQNFWPGFVDALTNLVLVLVFVVVVFTFALFFFSTQLAKQKVAEVEARCQQAMKVSGRDKAAGGIGAAAGLASATAVGAANAASTLTRTIEVTQTTPRAPGKADVTPVSIAGAGASVKISFAPGVADLTDKESAAIDTALGSNLAGQRYELTAQPAEASPSEGRRLAYYRIAAVRNNLIAKGVPPQNIDMTIGEPAPAGTPFSRVFIRVRPAGGQ